MPPGKTFDERFNEFKNSVNVNHVIESPPTDTLFSECEWRDWMSNDYPGRLYAGAEYELKDLIKKDPTAFKKLKKHICGGEPQNAYMVDAVTRDTCTPWRELKYGENNEHMVSHYKITPYFGYSCMDSNMNTKRGCQDMKIRYCCLKKKVASWTNWNQWSKCTVSCGGGKQKRTRKLENCADCVNNGIDERSTKEIRPCSVNNCPVDFTWTEWTPYGDCSKTCGQGGYKMRTRECIPAAHGGEPCPDKELQENVDLYQEEEACTKEDCLVYVYTNWSPWSQCSKTCGKGTKIKTRDCQEKNTLQKSEHHFCQTVQEGNRFEISETCLLTHCAIDGGWTDWTGWSECSQNCRAEGASEGEIGETVAHRKRYKYCTNPMAQHGGKECAKPDGKNVKYDFAQDALVEKGDCESDLPFCPENCKFTEWSEWSPCSETCIPSGPAKLLNADQGDEYQMFPDYENLRVGLTNLYAPLPTRTRARFELSKAKHGGTCPWTNGIECVNQTGAKPISMLEEVSACKLWDGQQEVANPNDYTTYPPTEFPVKEADKDVLGYCPIDCEWGPWQLTVDCKNAQEETFDDYEDCWMPSILEYILGFQKAKKEQKHFQSNFQTVFNAIKEAKNNLESIELELYDYEDYGMAAEDASLGPQLPQLKGQCLKMKGLTRQQKKQCRRGQGVMKLGRLQTLWDADMKTLKRISVSESTRKAKLPVLDGLFGGKACTMVNGVQLTTSPVQGGGDQSKVQSHIETKTDECSWSFCPSLNGVGPQGGKPAPYPDQDPRCKQGRWSPWDRWDSCEGKCGSENFRTRKRRCEKIGVCLKDGEEEGAPAENCSPALIRSREVSDTETARCPPCPLSQLPSWGPWTAWAMTKTCGKGKKIRSRTCLDQSGKAFFGGCPDRLGQPKETEQHVIPHLFPDCSVYG